MAADKNKPESDEDESETESEEESESEEDSEEAADSEKEAESDSDSEPPPPPKATAKAKAKKAAEPEAEEEAEAAAPVAEAKGEKATLKIWRGNREDGGAFETYEVETYPGMVVLDAVHDVQAKEAPDLAVRWNCKAGRCGSCSAEINGKPRLLCMTRMSHFEPGEPITVTPMKTFPLIKDLVTDVSHNFKVAKKIPPFTPRPRDADGHWRMQQIDIDRIQEFRKCIECFLCQDVCHVLRDHDLKENFAGPRFMIHLATLDMHPLDTIDRRPMMKEEFGIGYCNITRCCTEVCPEHITITDNGIIPLKERVADDFFDPVRWLVRKVTGEDKKKRLPVLSDTDKSLKKASADKPEKKASSKTSTPESKKKKKSTKPSAEE